MSLWTPTSLLPDYWFDAADTGTTTVSSGNLSAWTSKGSVASKSASNAATAPTAVTINGRQAFSTAGNSQMNTNIAGSELAGPLTIITMFDGSPAAPNNTIQPFHTVLSEYTQAGVYWELQAYGSTSPGFFRGSHASNSSTGYINGVSPGGPTFDLSSFAATYASAGSGANVLKLFTGPNTGYRWVGVIAEILIYKSVLSDGNLQKVIGYLHHKWGAKNQLADTHPYKATPPGALVTNAIVAGMVG